MEVLYMQYESERIEYKSQMIDDIYKAVSYTHLTLPTN